MLEFNNDRKTMSTVIRSAALAPNNNALLLKGAPERVIEKCKTMMNSKGQRIEISAADKARLIEHVK